MGIKHYLVLPLAFIPLRNDPSQDFQQNKLQPTKNGMCTLIWRKRGISKNKHNAFPLTSLSDIIDRGTVQVTKFEVYYNYQAQIWY